VNDWLHITRAERPLIVSLPHTGTTIPCDLEPRLASLWLARLDTDWRVERLYDFAHALGATVVRTDMSRTVIDVNRDPEGDSLYPGRATTDLCPLTTFDDAALYHEGASPSREEIIARRARWFAPYHAALAGEIARLRARHPHVVLYDAHSIRSRVPRLFDGELPLYNIGANGAATCDGALLTAIARIVEASGKSFVVDGRFRGGWTTRHYGRPAAGVHAIQMELAQRAYLDEPRQITQENWPPPYDSARAEVTRAVLKSVLEACLDFAQSPGTSS